MKLLAGISFSKKVFLLKPPKSEVKIFSKKVGLTFGGIKPFPYLCSENKTRNDYGINDKKRQTYYGAKNKFA